MFKRFIKDLSGLQTETEEESVEGDAPNAYAPLSTEGSQPCLVDREDSAHLTAAAPSPETFIPPPEGDDSGETWTPRRGKWGGLLDGARNILDAIIDLGGSDSEDDRSDKGVDGENDNEQGAGGNQRRRRAAPLPAAAAYPAVAPADGDDHTNRSHGPLGDTTEPTILRAPASQPMPQLSEPSALLDDELIRAITAEVPLRHRQAQWRLAYSTQRDGISMNTMLRSARGRAPTVLVVRDMGRAVFGAFCSEPWRVAPRYYGTGETFVFQAAPRQVAWHWWYKKMEEVQNDFFMWGEGEAVAVGGAGGYALWLDEELARGVSRISATFGNDSLSTKEEFRIGAVELWWLT